MAEAWLGEDYGSDRLLLLGESAFSWAGEDGEIHHPPPEHPIHLVNNAIKGTPGRFMTMLTRGITACEAPAREQALAAWAKVAFFNYVPGTVGFGPRVRPTPEKWAEASLAFPKLLATLAPQTVIVLGKDLWKHMPDADVWLTDDVQGYALPDGQTAICWAVPHPSGGLSWRRLAQVIAFAARREIILK